MAVILEERGRGKFKPAPDYKVDEVKELLNKKIEEERQMAKENLDKAIILCMENNHKKLKKEKKKIAPKSIEVLSYLKKNS